jgi:hypothetical protein
MSPMTQQLMGINFSKQEKKFTSLKSTGEYFKAAKYVEIVVFLTIEYNTTN